MRLVRRFLSLCVVASGLSAASPDARDLVQNLSSPSVAGWALSDFDGDSKVDLATTGLGRGDGRGYAHEVRIDLSAFPETSFTFRSHSASVQLSAWDIDGDHDRDILILESSTLEPVGIWLNDGAGHFREGDLADFRDALDRRLGTSLTSASPGSGWCWQSWSSGSSRPRSGFRARSRTARSNRRRGNVIRPSEVRTCPDPARAPLPTPPDSKISGLKGISASKARV